jgi:hypothetical protein
MVASWTQLLGKMSLRAWSPAFHFCVIFISKKNCSQIKRIYIVLMIVYIRSAWTILLQFSPFSKVYTFSSLGNKVCRDLKRKWRKSHSGNKHYVSYGFLKYLIIWIKWWTSITECSIYYWRKVENYSSQSSGHFILTGHKRCKWHLKPYYIFMPHKC